MENGVTIKETDEKKKKKIGQVLYVLSTMGRSIHFIFRR